MLALHIRGAGDKVVSARLNLSHSIIYVGGVCNFLGSVLPQQTFDAMDGPVLQLTFVWQAKENTSSRREGGPTQKTLREGRPWLNLTPLFICFFFFFSPPPPESALCKLG